MNKDLHIGGDLRVDRDVKSISKVFYLLLNTGVLNHYFHVPLSHIRLIVHVGINVS